MKNVSNIKNRLLMLISILCITTSCENNELDSATIEEGFISSSESSTKTFEEESENVKIVLHMNFDSNTSERDALTQFETATAAYIAKDSQTSKFPQNKFRYRVITETSNVKHHNTDGTVHSRVWFNTSSGTRKYIKRLDNPNKDDFERGNTDYFLLEVTTSTPVCWVSIRPYKTAIGLKGTDGWGLKKFHVDMTPQMQQTSAQGYSRMFSYPNVLLDNISSDLWDKYEVTNISQHTGNLGFNCN